MEKNPAKPDGLNPEYMRLVAETAHTLGPWFVGSTPRYLMRFQEADGIARKINPLTIRSPHHTEEIATAWNYLLPTGANANLIAAAPELLVACEAARDAFLNIDIVFGDDIAADAVVLLDVAIAKAKTTE